MGLIFDMDDGKRPGTALVVYRPRGRPSLYTPELAARICDLIASSNRGLAHLLKQEDDLPGERTIYEWLERIPEFAQQYARAREAQADLLADEALVISDDATGDIVAGEKGYEVDFENIQRSKLRVDTRKWMAAKLAPKKYGDASRVEVTGANGAPVQLEAVRASLIERIARIAPDKGAREISEEPERE